jgi:hypothetical protein
MGDVPIRPEPEPSGAERVETGIRTVLAGHPRGAIRRIVLYLVVVIFSIAGIGIGGTLGLILGAISIGALTILAATDQLA